MHRLVLMFQHTCFIAVCNDQLTENTVDKHQIKKPNYIKPRKILLKGDHKHDACILLQNRDFTT